LQQVRDGFSGSLQPFSMRGKIQCWHDRVVSARGEARFANLFEKDREPIHTASVLSAESEVNGPLRLIEILAEQNTNGDGRNSDGLGGQVPQGPRRLEECGRVRPYADRLTRPFGELSRVAGDEL